MPKTHKGQKGRKDLVMFEPEAIKVVTDKKDPRFDPRSKMPINEAMVRSIMLKGVVQPLTIYADGDDVFVSMGHQRRINSIEANRRFRKAGKPTILVPCVWRKDDDIGLFVVRQMENHIRTGDNPVETAKRMQELIDKGGSNKDAALTFGCTEQTVKNTLALLGCDVKLQRWVTAGGSAIVAAKLSKLPREEQRKRFEKMEKAGALKGRRAQEAAVSGNVDPAVPKMRSRAFLERWREELAKENASGADVAGYLIGYVLGDDIAMTRLVNHDTAFEIVSQTADRAGERKKKAAA